MGEHAMFEEPKDLKQKRKVGLGKGIPGELVEGSLLDVPAAAQSPGARQEITGDGYADAASNMASAEMTGIHLIPGNDLTLKPVRCFCYWPPLQAPGERVLTLSSTRLPA